MDKCRSIIRRARLIHWRVAVGFGSLLAAGCVHNEDRYPPEWSPVQPSPSAECPQVAGRYVDHGEAASTCHEPRTNLRASFNCDVSLAHNWTDTEAPDWVELRQPDPDTLVIVSSNPTVVPVQLHRSSGDYACGPGGITLSLSASVMAMGSNKPHEGAGAATFNGVGTVIGGVEGLGTFGVRHLERDFAPAADGSLVMSVLETQTGTVVLVPSRIRDVTYVRWRRSGDMVAVPVPATGDGHTGVSSAPYDAVARFHAFGGWAPDNDAGANDVDGLYTGDGKVVALAPGPHWINSHVMHHSLFPLRDFAIVYAFRLDAGAGHDYRFASRPPACLPDGPIDAALGSHTVYRTQVTLFDSATAQPAHRMELPALCTSGDTPACSVHEPAGDSDRPGEQCVRLDNSDNGFYGTDGTAAARLPHH